jgi:two-component system, sensor histidine kinase and response regulator
MDSILQILRKTSAKWSVVPLVTRHTLRKSRNRARILLAEDNSVNQTLAVRLLEKRGYSVSVAGDGHAALQALEKERFDLILMDVQMPNKDGFEATAAMRAKEKSTGERITNRGNDRSCSEGRSGTMCLRRDGRICVEANSNQRAVLLR